MIRFTGLEEISPEDVLGVIYGAFLDLKTDQNQTFKVFDAATTEPVTTKTGLINDMVRRMVSFGSMLDKSHRLAYNDSLTGLPNMHAVSAELDKMLQLHKTTDQPLSILLIDGDDLSRYNKIGYLAGDQMINRLGGVLKDQMRPSDYLARWRTGDEFLILLQDTSIEQAISIAELVRESVIEDSEDWAYPITISTGVTGYPAHGDTTEELLHQAELGLQKAKISGKNQVCVCD
jgi:diguanylate cyclase (GGDEF)-like protein